MHTRKQHYGAIFGRWWGIVNGLWTLLSSADTIVGHFGSADFKESWNAVWIAPKWGWKVWGVGVAITTTVFALEYSYSKVRSIDQKLHDALKGTPEIKLKQPNAVYSEPVLHRFSDSHECVLFEQTVPFLKVRFVNDPKSSNPEANAKGVRAKIEYIRCSDNSCVLSIDGRWAETTQPSALSPLESKSHLLAADFGIGEERSLDIAYRDSKTKQYFAWNNDNYNYINNYYVCPKHLLDGDRFKVKIRLRGDYVDESFSLVFRAENEGFSIEQDIRQPS